MVEQTLIGNVAEAGDIILLAFALVLTLLVGLALVGIDTLVGRLGRRQRDESAGRRPDGTGR